MNRRGFLAGLSTAAMVGGLAACNSGTGTPAGGSDGDVQNATITYASWTTGTLEVLKQILPAFNEQFPGITVEPTLTPWKDYFTKLQTQTSSGTAPDVFAMNGVQFDLYASNGMIDPIDELVGSGGLDLSKYPAPLVERYQWEGKQYAVPENYDSVAAVYNKKLLADAGVTTMPTDDWTWDEFLAVAKQVTDRLKSKGIYGFTPSMGDSQITYYNSIPSAGGYVISPDRKKSGYDDPATIEGLKFFGDVLASGVSPTIQQLTDSPGTDWFINGKSAMTWVASYNLADLASSELAGDFQYVRLPTGKTNQCVVNGSGNVVSAKSANKAAARELVKFLSGPEYAQAVAKSGTIIPSHADAAQTYLDTKPEWNLQVFIDAAQDGYLYPTSMNTKAWDTLEAPALAPLWQGKESAEVVGAKLAEQMNAALAKE